MDNLAPERSMIVYRLTWPDVKALEKQMRKANIVLRVQHLALTVAVPCILVGVPLWIGFTEGFATLRKGGVWNFFPALMVGTVFGLLFYLNRRSTKKSGILDHEIAVALRDQGLWQKDHSGEGVTFWSFVKSISETPDQFFFRSGASGLFHVIPKRAFPSAEAARAFYAEALRLWNASHSSATTP